MPTYIPRHAQYHPSIIDLSLVKGLHAVNFTADVIDELGSDHLPVLTEYGAQVTNRPPTRKWLYEKANWAKFRLDINTKLIIPNKLETQDDLDKATEHIE